MKHAIRALMIAAASPALAACSLFAGKAVDPMPTALIPARTPSAGGKLVIVLPGSGDNLERLKKIGIAEAIQQGDPTAEVLLTNATIPYYKDGGLVHRLHDQIIAPARAHGQKDIWIAGASMGGMGALMYEREHPGEVTGLLLMAPYIGDDSLIEEIKKAGGLQQWEPGPPPAELNADTVPREEWRVIRGWIGHPETTRRVWLVCGDDDQFIEAARLVAPLLPPGHFLQRQGGHRWTVWNPGATEAMKKVGGEAQR